MTKDNFIMLPTVDFCFKELMQNPKVRKGFISALLKIHPDEVEDTILLPTLLSRESADDKQGIMDIRVLLKAGTQINMEMQVQYFEYWDERALFYLSKMFYSQIRKGESYEKLRKCTHVITVQTGLRTCCADRTKTWRLQASSPSPKANFNGLDA